MTKQLFLDEKHDLLNKLVVPQLICIMNGNKGKQPTDYLFANLGCDHFAVTYYHRRCDLFNSSNCQHVWICVVLV